MHPVRPTPLHAARDCPCRCHAEVADCDARVHLMRHRGSIRGKFYSLYELIRSGDDNHAAIIRGTDDDRVAHDPATGILAGSPALVNIPPNP